MVAEMSRYLGRFFTHDVPGGINTMTPLTRCSQRRINLHPTQDGIASVSDAAAKALMQARFPAGHRVSCDCMESNGKMKAEDCKNLNVYDGDNKRIAGFSIQDFQAAQTGDGSISILRRASTQDSVAQDAVIKEMARAFPCSTVGEYVRQHGGEKLTLAELNRQHAEFYKRGDL
jgi:hypothetical protein